MRAVIVAAIALLTAWMPGAETAPAPTATPAPAAAPAPESAPAAAPADAKAHPFLAENAQALVTQDGKKADVQRLVGRKPVFLHFSAHWCPPCRAFTPELVTFYQQNGGGERFEILFVSSDEAAADMMTYMKEAKMPWVGLRWGSSKTQKIKQRYAGDGIPDLVLLDERDEVLADSYVGGRYLGPHHVLDEYRKLARDAKK
jgi:nucleoredoxin